MTNITIDISQLRSELRKNDNELAEGITQEELLEVAEIDRAYMGRIERGSENVTVTRLETVAKTLGVHVSEFFKEIDQNNMPPDGLKAGRKAQEK